MSIEFFSKEKLEKVIRKKIKNTSVVLDVGCGIRPQNYINPMVHICAEPFDEYVEKLKEIAEHEILTNLVIIKSTWQDIIKIIPEKSVDTIFIIDVIEHLEKSEGKKLLEKTEHLAKKQIVIFTPLGFLPQKNEGQKDAWGLNGGAWQEHKSGWLPVDFDDSWNIYASKEYHFFDNNGNKFENPYGAFYAIKTNIAKERVAYKIIKKYFLLNNLVLEKIIKTINLYHRYKRGLIKNIKRKIWKKNIIF